MIFPIISWEQQTVKTLKKLLFVLKYSEKQTFIGNHGCMLPINATAFINDLFSNDAACMICAKLYQLYT